MREREGGRERESERRKRQRRRIFTFTLYMYLHVYVRIKTFCIFASSYMSMPSSVCLSLNGSFSLEMHRVCCSNYFIVFVQLLRSQSLT